MWIVSKKIFSYFILIISCCLRCVATNTGGNSDSVNDGENGLLVELDDIDALTKARLRIVRCKKLRKQLARDARKTTESRYSIDCVAYGYIKVYDQLRKCI